MAVIFIIVFICIKNNYAGGYNLLSEMTVNRQYHQMIELNNGDIFIAGGSNSGANRYKGIKDIEIYSIQKNISRKIADSNLPHLYHKLFKLTNGNIVIADIAGIEIYDFKKNEFRLLKTKPAPRRLEFNNYNFALLDNDLLIVAGGRKENSPDYLKLIEIIDLKNDKLIKTYNFNLNSFGMVKLQENKILIAGGRKQETNKEVFSDDIYIFDGKTMQINKWGKLHSKISSPFLFITSDNKLVVAGGELLTGYETFQNFGYPYTKGNPFIEIIDLKNKESEIKDIGNYLKKSKEKLILNADLLNDNLLFIQLKTGDFNNAVFLKIDGNKIKKLFAPSFFNISKFGTSTIKTKNNYFITGGRYLWDEVLPYDGSIQIPSAEDRNKPFGVKSVVKNIGSLNYK